MLIRWLVSICFAITAAGFGNLEAAESVDKKPEGTFPFTKGRTVTIHKQKGGLDEAIELPSGQFLIRDSNFKQLFEQAVELYSPQGKCERKIGSHGLAAGQYYAVKKLGFSREKQLIWVTDMQGRLTWFDLSGRLVNSMLLQKPGYRAFDLAVDEEHGVFYLTGCVAKNFYLDQGCYLIHQYNLATDAHQKSILETDPEAVQKNLLGIEDYLVDVDSGGLLYAVDAPIRKWWRIDPVKWSVDEFAIRSKAMTPIAPLDPTQANTNVAQRNYMIERVLATPRGVLLSVRRPDDSGYLLEIFALDGRQSGVDVRAPGRLAGRSSNGGLWFSRKTASGYELTEYIP